MEKEYNSLKVKIIEKNDIANDKKYCGSIKAIFSTFNNVNYKNDIMLPDCFDQVISEFNLDASKMPRYLEDHRDGYYNGLTKRVIGVIDNVYRDENSAYFDARYINTTAGNDAYIEAVTGAVNEYSFGWVCAEFSITQDGVRIVKRVSDFDEISQVLWGADGRTRPVEINSKLTIRDAEKILHNGGFTQEQSKTIVSKGYNALSRDGGECGREGLNDLETILALNNINLKLKETITK